MTELARQVLRCVHELRGRFGKGMVADVLRGANNQKVREFGLDQARNYGVTEAPATQVKEVIELLASEGYLEISEGRFPLVGLGARFREAGADDFRMSIKRVSRKRDRDRGGQSSPKAFGGSFGSSGTAGIAGGSGDADLFERLRKLRKRLADASGVPPYVVSSDATLRDMCAKLPRSDEKFLEVSGVGQKKLDRYGAAFMAEIEAYLNEGAPVGTVDEES